MTVAPVSVLDLGDQLWVALGGAEGTVATAGPVNLFRGKVTAPPLDDDGAVHPYAVLYDTPGRRYGRRIGTRRDGLAGMFQVTCVGGDTERCLWCVDQVTSRLTGRLIAVPSRERRARLVEDDSNSVRTVIEDQDVTPYRYFVPLLFNFRI